MRQSYRDGGTVKKRTDGNLSHLPRETLEPLRRYLSGEAVMGAGYVIAIERSKLATARGSIPMP